MSLRDTLFLRAYALWKIPMIFFCGPTVQELNDDRCVIRIPLTRRTKNHLNSLYFAAFAVGGDIAAGIIAMRLIRNRKVNVSIVFKDFKAEFLKRPEADVDFVCEAGAAIREAIDRAVVTGERQNVPVPVTAICPKLSGNEPVAQLVLTLSLKKKA